MLFLNSDKPSLAFTTLVGGINDQHKEEEKVDEGPKRKVIKGMDKCTFADVKTLKPLGAGGFGLVKLVQIKGKRFNSNGSLPCN